jgi:hypothetical protein
MLAISGSVLVIVSTFISLVAVRQAKRGHVMGKLGREEAIRSIQGSLLIPVVFGIAAIAVNSPLIYRALNPALFAPPTPVQVAVSVAVGLLGIAFGFVGLARSKYLMPNP